MLASAPFDAQVNRWRQSKKCNSFTSDVSSSSDPPSEINGNVECSDRAMSLIKSTIKRNNALKSAINRVRLSQTLLIGCELMRPPPHTDATFSTQMRPDTTSFTQCFEHRSLSIISYVLENIIKQYTIVASLRCI